MQDLAKKLNHRWLKRTFAVIFVLSALLAVYSTNFTNLFASKENLQQFLQSSNSYYYTSQIIVNGLQTKVVEPNIDNIVEEAVINRAIEFTVTPQLVSRVLEPALELQVNFLNSDGDKLERLTQPTEINLVQYKVALSTFSSKLGLSGDVSNSLNQVAQKMPDSIELFAKDSATNQVASNLLKIRQTYQAANSVETLAWVLFVLSILYFVILGFDCWQIGTKTLAKLFILSGVALLVLNWLVPFTISALNSNSDTPNVSSLISSITSTFFELSLKYALFFIGLGLINLIVHFIITPSKARAKISNFTKGLRK